MGATIDHEPLNAVDPDTGVDPQGEPFEEPAPAGHGDLTRRIALFVLGALAAVVLALNVLPSLSGRGSGTPPANIGVVTDDLVTAFAAAPETETVHGSFVPGSGLLLDVTASDLPRAKLFAWCAGVLKPFAKRLAATDGLDRLVILVSVEGDAPYVRGVIVPAASAARPATYSTAAGVAGNTDGVGTATQPTGTQPTGTAPSGTEPSGTAPSGAPDTTAPDTTAPDTTSPGTTAPTSDAATPTTVAQGTGNGTGGTPPAGAEANGFDAAAWTPLAGQWKLGADGYSQTDPSGFDYIAQLTTPPPANYVLTVSVAAIEGNLNGGVIVNQPKLGRRNGATMVDLTDNSGYIRWGHYDDGGSYVFDGGAKLANPIDPKAGTTLTVTMTGAEGQVALDGQKVGSFTAPSAAGTVGLVSSEASLRFSGFSVVAQ